MSGDLESEIRRVARLASEAQHSAHAATLMGGSGKTHKARRDALLAKLRAASVALAAGSDDDRAKSLAELRAEAE